MWDDIKNWIGFACIIITGLMVAALVAGVHFLKGWKQGIHLMFLDSGMPSETFNENATLIYWTTFVVIWAVIFVGAKILDKVDASLLWVPFTLASAALVAAPYLYVWHFYPSVFN